MNPVLKINSISKSYGRIRALKQASFEVPQGSVFGILGPNGSGKTTMLSIILDVLKQDKGSFFWFGQPGSNSEIRRRIGSLLETPNFYHYMSGMNNLKVTSRISGRGNEKDIRRVLVKVNLYERRNSRFSSYSLGMKQRLAIAGALLGDPKVLVLDEPTNGLDPVGIAEIRKLIVELKENGHTVIMASHLLDEVEKVCTHVAILKEGSVVSSGPVEEVLLDDDVVELGAADIERLASVVSRFSSEVAIQQENNTVHIVMPRGTAKLDEINNFCFSNNITLNHLLLRKKKLETRFFELTGN